MTNFDRAVGSLKGDAILKLIRIFYNSAGLSCKANLLLKIEECDFKNC